MLSVKTPLETLDIIMAHFGARRMDEECVPLSEALDRSLARDVTASEFVPDFNRSTVDGYAVIAADTFGCAESTPALISCIGEVEMGQAPKGGIAAGECMYVPTGGELPRGADAMVMLEYVEDYGDMLGILKSSPPGANVIFRGDDVAPGQIVYKAGKRLAAKDIGTLAALGCAQVYVRRKPRVAIIATGDELVPVESSASGATVRDVNSHELSAGVSAVGGEAWRLGIVEDDYARLVTAIGVAVQGADVVLISGGSSVGTRDATARAIADLGKLLLHGVAMKPGKPTIIGEIDAKPVFGLPGHPMAAYFIFHIFVRPLIASLMGQPSEDRCIMAALECAVPSNHGREECVPVRLRRTGDGYTAVPVMGKSGLITTLCAADGYVRIPRDAEGVSCGDIVEVWLF
ncbi:MAG: molybdopterin-binding protein [Clostridia bacterium]